MQDLHGEAARAFHEVAAEMEDLVFGVAEEDELFEAYGLSADTVCLFKKVSGLGAVGLLWGPVLTVPCLQFDEGRTDFPVDPEQGLDVAKLTQQLVVHSLKLVMDYSNEVWLLPTPAPAWLQGAWPHPPSAPQTSSQIFGAKIPHHMLLFLNTSVAEQQALRDEFRVAASTFRGEVRWSHGKKGWDLGDHSFSAARPPPPGALCGGGCERVRCRRSVLLRPDAQRCSHTALHQDGEQPQVPHGGGRLLSHGCA